MKIKQNMMIAMLGIVASGCMSPSPGVSPVMATPEYATREPIESSLFPSDQMVLSEEAVSRVLASKLELPAKAKLAIMKFPDSEGPRFRYYWRDEHSLKLHQQQVDALSRVLLASEQVSEVVPLPSLMTPQKVSIPILREAAVRMQADLLLIFRVGTDTYSQYRAFAKDKAKAYSTCEMVLLDVRTGLVPFTRVISRERLEMKQAADLEFSETVNRAEEASGAEALKAAAEELVIFVKSVPKKGG